MRPGEKSPNYYKVHRLVYKRRERLLDMEYTTGELASELGVSPKYVRDTMIAKYGAPYRQDKKGRIWLEGLKVKEWMEAAYDPKKNKVSLAGNEFYCVKCRGKRVSDQYILTQNNGTILKQAHCPICGALMNKFSGRQFDD